MIHGVRIGGGEGGEVKARAKKLAKPKSRRGLGSAGQSERPHCRLADVGRGPFSFFGIRVHVAFSFFSLLQDF